MTWNLSQYKKTIVLTTMFFFASMWMVPHHEMWRDELQAWLLARDSHTVTELFQNLKYEGHPALWHLLLMPLTRVFQSPISMQYFNLLISTASVYILGRCSPFSWPQKILIAFGYYIFYEYGTIARNYSLGVLLAFTVCALFPLRKERPFAVAIALVLLGNTSVLGLILAIAFWVGLFYDQCWSGREEHDVRPDNSAAWLAGLATLVGFGATILQLKPPADSGFAVAWTFTYSTGRLNEAILAFQDAYFPISKLQFNYWNSRILPAGGGFAMIAMVLNICIFLVVARNLLSRPVAAIVYIFATLCLVAFFYTKYIGAWRHHGFIYLALISGLWIAPFCKQTYKTRLSRYWPALPNSSFHIIFSAVLVIQVVGTTIAAFQEYKYPFSQARDAATFIRNQGLDQLPIVGDGSPQASAVAGYLPNKQFFYIDADRFGSFVRWDNQRNKLVNGALLDKVGEIGMNSPEGVLLVFNHPLSLDGVDSSKFVLLYESAPAVVGDEVFFVYRVKT